MCYPCSGAVTSPSVSAPLSSWRSSSIGMTPLADLILPWTGFWKDWVRKTTYFILARIIIVFILSLRSNKLSFLHHETRYIFRISINSFRADLINYKCTLLFVGVITSEGALWKKQRLFLHEKFRALGVKLWPNTRFEKVITVRKLDLINENLAFC